MTPEELVEIVARALCGKAGADPDALVSFTNDKSIPRWMFWRPQARAALRAVRDALREPDEGMIEAWRLSWATSNPQIEWRAMIEASPLGRIDDA